MPGYVIHLAMANKILKMADTTIDEDWKYKFLIGNIIADMRERNEKKESHFWSDENYKSLVRKPDTDTFLKKYENRLDDPYMLGYFYHLFLDRMFIEKYWNVHFTFYDADKRPNTAYEKVAYVKVKGHKDIYKREEFFSNKLYYGDYDRMNNYFVNNYSVDVEKIGDYIKTHTELAVEELDEIKFSDSKERLEQTLAMLTKDNNDIDKPQLTIFELEDLEELIDETAVFLCKNYSIHKNVT